MLNITHFAAFRCQQSPLQSCFALVGCTKYPLFGAKKVNLSVPYNLPAANQPEFAGDAGNKEAGHPSAR
jgi:hypothetical protein